MADLEWIASPYGLALCGMVCALIGFIVSRGIRFDKGGKVKIGSDRFTSLFDCVNAIKSDVQGLAVRLNGLTARADAMAAEVGTLKEIHEATRVTMLKLIITNPQLPVSLRAEAYDEYHGSLCRNGWVKVYYEAAVKPLLEKQVQEARP
jgi:hypothetical protein